MKNYEELTGGRGKQILYRAERYRARDLFRTTLPDLIIDEAAYVLHDLSMNGMAAYAQQGSNDIPGVGTRANVRLSVKGAVLHDGLGEISRSEPTPFGTKIAVKVLDRCINVSTLAAKYREALVRAEVEGSTADAAPVPVAYKVLCAEVLHLLRGFRAALSRFEETATDRETAAEMLASCERRALPRWRALWHRANEIVAPLLGDAEAVAAVKRFTELVLTPEFMGGKIWRRSFEKPLGYPGDFEIMNQVYAWQREGASLFDQLLHRLGLDVAECIATRGVMMRQSIAELCLRRSGERMAHVANIGCGPAREVVDYLQMRALPCPIHFTLLDQDHAALSQAYEQTYSEVIRHKGRAGVTLLHTSFSQLLKAGELFGTLPPQDLIYSVGLVDYLAPKRARALIASLYDRLAPDGTLIVANMFATNTGNLWPMEFLCDWPIIYRSEADMLDLAAGLNPARTDIAKDPTGRVCLMTLRKSA
jgi:extracellular factor (EF) 3-hydroxypalmitic acid methyl ester biosynthesis protein